MNPLDGIDLSSAVDLDQMPCIGCKHRSSKGACKRYPPIFKPATPVMGPNGPSVAEGGWCFPPAAQKCGEFTA